MNESLALLEQINWILKPVSDIIVFFFATTTGISLLIAGFVIYVLANVGNALYERSLLHSAANSHVRRMSIVERIYLVIAQLGTIAINIVSKLPVFLGVLIMLTTIVGVSSGLQTMQSFYQNQERITELRTVIKHLDKEYKVAEMTVVNVDYSDLANITSELSFRFYDYAELGFKKEAQEIKIKGNDIYVDALVLNFEYSQIEAGNHNSLTIPYRVFSNVVPQREGISLNLRDDNGIPYIFRRSSDALYGISDTIFNTRMNELSSFLTDEDKAREAGVRTSYGQFVHKRVMKGEVVSIWITQGGLVMKNEQSF